MAKNDFNAEVSVKELKESIEGVLFDGRLKDSICRSKPVRDEIKEVFWEALKEKIVWIILGAGSIVILDVLKSLVLALISKIH